MRTLALILFLFVLLFPNASLAQQAPRCDSDFSQNDLESFYNNWLEILQGSDPYITEDEENMKKFNEEIQDKEGVTYRAV